MIYNSPILAVLLAYIAAMLTFGVFELMRIRDRLNKMFTEPINSYGEGIGDAIQGQIIRGQDGVSQYDRR